MSFVFDVNSAKHPTTKKRLNETDNMRAYSNHVEHAFDLMKVNAGAALPIPTSIFDEVDRVTKKVMTEPTTDVVYQDLMALSRPVDIGALKFIDRVSSDSGAVSVSMSMSTEHVGDITAYKQRETHVPIFQGGAVRQPREVAAWKHAGFDVLLDDHENAVRAVRNKISDSFLNGAVTDTGNEESYGLLNDPLVKEYKTKVDFTSQATSGEDMRNAMLAALQQHRIDSLVISPRTVYVSLDIDAQLDRKYIPTDAASRTIREELLSLPLVKEIKPTALVTGNNMIAGVLSSEFIRSIVGQEVSSFSNIRQTPFDPFKWYVWAGVGLNIRADYNGRCGFCRITK